MNLHEISAVQLKNLIQRKEISATETVLHFISRIERINPRLNAFVANRFDLAISEAKTLDKASSRLSLQGLPFSTKEMICVEGLPNTCGSTLRKNVVAKENAVSIERLKQCGAIPLGVTNIPEFTFWIETYNLVYGRTNNPYDLKRTSGGSSGGEAAAVSSGLVAFGIGSDTGGSIRQPAGFCGIFGHRPSRNLVPITGHLEGFGIDAQSSISIGPMTRFAEDLNPILREMIGPDGRDRKITKVDLGHSEKITLKGRRFFTLDDPHLSLAGKVSPEIRRKLEEVAQTLETLGAIRHSFPNDLFKHAFKMWGSNLKEAANIDVRELIGNGARIRPFKKIFSALRGKPEHIWPLLAFAAAEELGLDRWNNDRYLSLIKSTREYINNELREDGFLLFPTAPTNAPLHGRMSLKPLQFVYSGIFNALDLPATTVPLALDANGLPFALQIIGGIQKDALTISLAQTFEDIFGGWVPPKISELPRSEFLESQVRSAPLEL